MTQNPESETDIIENLRGRLARRNELLDVLRKAYHRDVLAIKEYIIDAEKEGLVVNTSALSSLPSIDLREGGFRLFAPHECELKVRPCNDCGGQLEVIHRESSRIVQYKHAIQQMEDQEIDLRIEVIDAKSQAKKDRDRLVDEMQRSENDRVVLMNQIEHLKSQLSNRNAEVERLLQDKAHLELTLEQQQPIISDNKRLVVEIQNEKEESRRWQDIFHEEQQLREKIAAQKSSVIAALQNQTSETEQLHGELQHERLRCKTLEELSTNLEKKLSGSQCKEKEHIASLKQAEGKIDDLKSILAHDRDQLSCEIDDLKDKNKQLTARVNDLDELSRCQASEAKYFRGRLEGIFKGRGSISVVPSTVDDQFSTAEEVIRDYETLSHEARTLSRLLTSCIRTMFESCIDQEKILKANNSELHRNVQIKGIVDTPNKTSQLVIGNLENAAKSEAIDWQSIVSDAEDRNHVLGSLTNRQQIGQLSLLKAFEKERKRYDSILSKCQYEHDKETEKHQGKIKDMERHLTEATNVIRKYEKKMINLQKKYALGVVPMLTSVQDLLLQVRKEEKAFHKLKEDFLHLRGVTDRLLAALRASKEEISSLQMTISSQNVDVSERDAAIIHFEEMLTKITHKYAENELKHNKVTQEKSVQASVTVKEASTYDDFLRLSLDKRSIQQEENNPPRDHALLPGRIFPMQIRENIGKIQLRRALDKL